MAGAMPEVLGFRRRPVSRFFRLQAAREAFIVSATDWKANEPCEIRRRAA